MFRTKFEKVVLIVFLLVQLNLSSAFAVKSASIEAAGKIHKVEEKVDLGSPYFFYHKSGKDEFGYPVVFSKNVSSKLIKHCQSHICKLKGTIVTENIQIGEFNREVPTLKISTLEKISLAPIANGAKEEKVNLGIHLAPTEKAPVGKKGISMSDNFTNAVIFGAGAALVGSIIKDMVKR